MQTNRNHQKYFKNYRANKVVWAAQLRKGNFKDMVEGLKYHGATGKVEADLEKYTITFNAHNSFSDANGTVNLGDFIIFENSGPIVVPAYKFKSDYSEIYRLSSWYTPTLDEVKVLECLNKGDTDLCYGYDYITSETELDRDAAKKAVDNLRIMGAVKFYRGLMDDDGEVAGAGFTIGDTDRAEALLYRHYRIALEDNKS